MKKMKKWLLSSFILLAVFGCTLNVHAATAVKSGSYYLESEYEEKIQFTLKKPGYIVLELTAAKPGKFGASDLELFSKGSYDNWSSITETSYIPRLTDSKAMRLFEKKLNAGQYAIWVFNWSDSKCKSSYTVREYDGYTTEFTKPSSQTVTKGKKISFTITAKNQNRMLAIDKIYSTNKNIASVKVTNSFELYKRKITVTGVKKGKCKVAIKLKNGKTSYVNITVK